MHCFFFVPNIMRHSHLSRSTIYFLQKIVMEKMLPKCRIVFLSYAEKLNLYVQVNGAKKSRIHYSGPLMPPGVNMEEILREHERQIQQAVRRARLDMGKGKNHVERDQLESLLYTTQNGRP